MKKGFTLIELLVVVAIIGILSGVVIASIQKIRCEREGYEVCSPTKDAPSDKQETISKPAINPPIR